MKITTTIALAELKVKAFEIDRSNMRECLERELEPYIRKVRTGRRTRFGCGPFTHDGFNIVEVHEHRHARRDIASISLSVDQFTAKTDLIYRVTVFVEIPELNDGRTHDGPQITVADGTTVELDANDHAYIDQVVRTWLKENDLFVQRNRRWYQERPWEAVTIGDTIEVAIEKLKNAGW